MLLASTFFIFFREGSFCGYSVGGNLIREWQCLASGLGKGVVVGCILGGMMAD